MRTSDETPRMPQYFLIALHSKWNHNWFFISIWLIVALNQTETWLRFSAQETNQFDHNVTKTWSGWNEHEKKMQKKQRRGKETRTNDNQFQFCHAIFQCSSFITETIQSWTRKKPRPNKNTWHNHIWDFFWRFYMRWCHKLSIAQSFCIIFFNLKIARNVTNKKKASQPFVRWHS